MQRRVGRGIWDGPKEEKEERSLIIYNLKNKKKCRGRYMGGLKEEREKRNSFI